MSTTTGVPTPTPTPTDELLHDIAEEAPLADPVRRRRILLGLGVTVVVLALVFVTLRVFGGDSQQEKDAAALVQVQEQVLPELQALMTERTTFFDSERAYLATLKQAEVAVRRYNQNGGRPVPDFSAEVTELRKVTGAMTALATKLEGESSAPGVTSDAHDYLLSATRVMNRDARRNIAVLESPRGRIVLVAVGNENALNSIKRMNKSLTYVLDAAQLPPKDFDLPGGADAHPEDHSTTM